MLEQTPSGRCWVWGFGEATCRIDIASRVLVPEMPPKSVEKTREVEQETTKEGALHWDPALLRGELVALRASIDEENKERLAAIQFVNEQRLTELRKENEKMVKDVARKEADVRKIANRAVRDAKARADQRGIFRQADLLEDVAVRVEGARGVLEKEKHLVISEEIVAKVRSKTLVDEDDFKSRLLSESIEAVKEILAMLDDAIGMIDERRAELEVLAQASSREEGFDALAIMNQTSQRSNLAEVARSALKQAAEGIKAKEKDKEKKAERKGKGEGKGGSKKRKFYEFSSWQVPQTVGYTQQSGPGRYVSQAQPVPMPAQNQSISTGFPGGAGGGPCWNCGQQGHKVFQCQQPRRTQG
jgi:hypothetical protein